ncbi:MAG TPA: flagellar hook-length control protein FliK [Rhodopseudomonas sp.]|uniref:flagellar hook-length control protein FliK n=1 Tax=Rhodopseudomonas sp. TaxID=1078 RepID=UPI002EDA0F29
MTKADPLLAAFRQLAVAKSAAKGSAATAAAAKDRPDKIERFRDQLKVIAQAAKPGAKPATDGGKTDEGRDAATPHVEVAARGAEIADEDEVSSRRRAGKSTERSTQHAAAEAAASASQWRNPDSALSLMIAQFDQAHSPPSAEADATAPPAHPRVEPRDADLTPVDLTRAVDAASSADRAEPRVTLSIDSAETRTLPPVKVAVRDQETHFEPVQQLTQLQKIVDRMSAELPAAATPAVGASADVAPSGLTRATEGPVKSLTLQLDPPDLGAVTVKMRLAGDAVEIRLSAERADTAQLLRHERGALTDLMQSAGYKFDIAAIDHSQPGDANAGSGQQQPQSDQRSSQQPQGGAQINFAEQGRQSSDAQAGSRHNRQQHEHFTAPADRPQDNDVVRDRADGAVYL